MTAHVAFGIAWLFTIITVPLLFLELRVLGCVMLVLACVWYCMAALLDHAHVQRARRAALLRRHKRENR